MNRDRRRPRLFKVYDFAGDATEDAGPPMTKAELARSFGRPHPDGEAATAADIGCPECPGVLYVSAVGSRGWLSFRCRIGHAFSADSLVAAKEDQLEDSFWSTLETLEELVQLYRALELREQLKPDSPRHHVLVQRLALAERHLQVLKDLISNEGPAPITAAPVEGK